MTTKTKAPATSRIEEIRAKIDRTEQRMGERIRDLKEAKKERARLVADGADPAEASRKLKQIEEELHGLNDAATLLQDELKAAHAAEEQAKARRDLDLFVAEAERIAGSYDNTMSAAVEAAEEYAEKANAALGAHAEVEGLRRAAEVLCDLHGLEVPEMPRIPGKDERMERIFAARKAVHQKEDKMGRYLRITQTTMGSRDEQRAQEAKDSLLTTLDRLADDLRERQN